MTDYQSDVDPNDEDFKEAAKPFQQQQKLYDFYSDDEVYFGLFPSFALQQEEELIKQQTWNDAAFQSLERVRRKANKLYVSTRPLASNASVARAKLFLDAGIAVHPLFGNRQDIQTQEEILSLLRSYKPSVTIFEGKAEREHRPSHDFSVLRSCYCLVSNSRIGYANQFSC